MASETLLVAERDSDAPNTAIVETSARPTISAAAVCAVRRGLRIEFCRPSRPGTPRSRARGRPSTLAIGRAISGESMPTPMKINSAPMPTRLICGAVKPMARAIPPRSAAPPPTMVRRNELPSVPASMLCSAAIGAIRTARRAGLIAETTVTPTPTTSATMTVRGAKTSEPVGNETPNALRSASRPIAIATPATRPTTEARRPMTPASAMTERNT